MPVGRPFKKGSSGNPGGRPRKTEEERAGEEYLRSKTRDAAQRLVELQSSDDEKVALGAVVAHLRITVGDLSRVSDRDGEALLPQHIGMTKDELLAAIKKTGAK